MPIRINPYRNNSDNMMAILTQTTSTQSLMTSPQRSLSHSRTAYHTQTLLHGATWKEPNPTQRKGNPYKLKDQIGSTADLANNPTSPVSIRRSTLFPKDNIAHTSDLSPATNKQKTESTIKSKRYQSNPVDTLSLYQQKFVFERLYNHAQLNQFRQPEKSSNNNKPAWK